ncbi:MAG: hypothetical protein KGJ57_08520 [Sphingomonadales bacterium]|nr:hypothetical protein [Sphingomonadales bacterium]MDE2169455.1 hypothetical protein [Sphingomonadales bacterium]
MQALLLLGLWALLLQWGMLFFVRFSYPSWTWRQQHLIAGLVLPVAVAGIAVWLWLDPASCSQPLSDTCVRAHRTAFLALILSGMLLVAAGVLAFIDRMRKRR